MAVQYLTDICDIQYGFAFDASGFTPVAEEGMPLVRIRDVMNGRTETYFKGDFPKEYIIHKGDFLVGMDGEFNIAPWQSEDALLNQRVCRVKSNQSGVSSKFLYWFLKKELKRIEDETPFVTVKHLSAKRLKQVKLDVPSLSQQESIASELDTLTDILDKKKQQLEELDKLAQSIFYDMFGDPITNEKGWDKKKIGSFSSCLAGATPSTTHEEYWENGTIPWLSSGEVGKGRIYETEKSITQVGYESCSTRLVPAHTLVIAMAGQGKTRGTAGVAEIPLCTNQSICSIIPNEKVALVDFLFYQMQQMYKDLRSISNGDGGRGGLNLKLIGNYPVIVPPLSLQYEFAQKIEAIEKQKELVKRSIVETETLFNSRMDYWFN